MVYLSTLLRSCFFASSLIYSTFQFNSYGKLYINSYTIIVGIKVLHFNCCMLNLIIAKNYQNKEALSKNIDSGIDVDKFSGK